MSLLHDTPSRPVLPIRTNDQEWVSEQLSSIRAEMRLLTISSIVTVCIMGATLAILLLEQP